MDSKPFRYPPEIRLLILENVANSDQGLWKEHDDSIWARHRRLQQIRLVDRAWCQTADQILSSFFMVPGIEDPVKYRQRLATLSEVANTDKARQIKKFGLQIPLGLEHNDFHELLMDHINPIIPETVPMFQNLEELHLHLGGDKKDCGFIDDDIYPAFGKCLTARPLPHLHTFRVDLRTPCDIYHMMQPDLAERETTDQSQNESQLESKPDDTKAKPKEKKSQAKGKKLKPKAQIDPIHEAMDRKRREAESKSYLPSKEAEGKSYLAANLARIRSLTVTVSEGMYDEFCCIDWRFCGFKGEIFDEETFSSGDPWGWGPTERMLNNFDYSFSSLEHLDLIADDRVELVLPTGFSSAHFVPKLRLLRLRQCKIDLADLIGFVNGHERLEEMDVHRIVATDDKALKKSIEYEFKKASKLRTARVGTEKMSRRRTARSGIDKTAVIQYDRDRDAEKPC